MEELGCWQEAQRADQVAAALVRIREDLSPESADAIPPILEHLGATSRLLRDLHDLFPIHRSRVPLINHYLTVILPCLQKTLRDMKAFLDCEDFAPEVQWSLIQQRLNNQGEMTLVNRFVMYVDYLVQVVRLLSRVPLYDPTLLEALRIKVVRLRLARGIPVPPMPVQPYFAPVHPSSMLIEKRHWAEKIFGDQPITQTLLAQEHRRDSKCSGPAMPEIRLGIPLQPSVLFKLPFDKHRLSVIAYHDNVSADSPRLLCRYMDQHNYPYYSSYGVHELSIRRRGSALKLKYVTDDRQFSQTWLLLFFKTWQRLVLFHCAFLALKARSISTTYIAPEEYRIEGEKKRFQGQIFDDGFQHSLYIFQDVHTHTYRLHAAVGDGELKKCPVWTAFISDLQISSDTWIERRSRHRVWVKDLQIFVFCNEYRRKAQIKRHGEFELNFTHATGADAFINVFAPADSDSEDEIRVIDVPGPN